MVVQVVWKADPLVMADRVADYGRRVLAGLHALADLFAARIEAYAKQHAPWNDQTGAARQGLRAFAEKSASGVVLFLVHSVSYGVYLEMGTRRMGARPIIGPALEAHYGAIMAAVRNLIGGR